MNRQQPPLQLSEAPVGKRVRIKQLRSRPEVSLRLRELGLCEEATVRCILRSHGNMICEVLDARIGLNMRLAGSIFVSNPDRGDGMDPHRIPIHDRGLDP